jgi:hypothetical protein
VEAGQAATLIGKIKGRKVGGRQKAQAQDTADIGPHQPLTRIKQDRQVRRLSPGQWARKNENQQNRENRGPQPHEI